MMPALIFILFTWIISVSVFGQTNDSSIRQQVLEKDIVDSSFIFGKWTKDGETETHLKYLGKVITKDHRILKIMNSCWIWGLSHRATNRILIYNNKNQYLGNYYLTTTEDLPDKLEDGLLFFSNIDNHDCDKELISKINLTNGIPLNIFLKCNDNDGNIYKFSSDKKLGHNIVYKYAGVICRSLEYWF